MSALLVQAELAIEILGRKFLQKNSLKADGIIYYLDFYIYRYLNLQDAIIIGNSKFINGSDLKYLNNSFQDSSSNLGNNETVLKELTASTNSLEKLSLEKLSFKYDFAMAIVQNCQTLTVLYLSCCKGGLFSKDIF